MSLISLDLLGLANKTWNVKETAKAWPDSDCGGGAFDDVFGNLRPHYIELQEELYKLGKELPFFRVQGHWSYQHVIAPIDKVKRKARKWARLQMQFPATKIYLSHSCEHNCRNQREIKQRMKIIRDAGLVPVNAPLLKGLKQGITIPGEINETHDSERPIGGRYCFSYDGEAEGAGCVQMNANKVRRRHRKAEVQFLWAARFNLRVNDDGKPHPTKRKHPPSREYIEGVLRMGKRKGRPPQPEFTGQFRKVKKPMLYKVYSEDKGTGDPRANKPLLICPSSESQLRIFTYKGQDIGCLGYYGPFQDTGLNRFYSGVGSREWGYQIAQKALKKSGSEFVWFRDDSTGVYYGPVHAAFRQGFYK